MPANKSALNAVVAIAAFGALAISIIAISCKCTDSVINITPSLANTIYKIDATGAKDTYASFCPPIPRSSIPAGWCEGGNMPLLKRVVGVAGDVVKITPAGVFINGKEVPNSKFQAVGYDGIPMPKPKCLDSCTIQKGEIWLAGDTLTSYDSRYFGPVLIKNLRQI